MLGEELGSDNHNPFNSLENLRTFSALVLFVIFTRTTQRTDYNDDLRKGYDASHLHLFEEKHYQNSVKYSSINGCD